MKRKFIPGMFILVAIFITTSSFSMEPVSKKFTPVGTWKFSAPSAPEGYNTSDLIISKEVKEYKLVFALNEYYQITANEVVYKKKNLSFILYIETETVQIKGTFEDDKFSGTASYSEGVIDVTAVRKKEAEK